VYPHLDVRVGRESERYLLELRNVPYRTSLKPGTAIFSSGLGGAWPRGVLIGTIMDALQEPESWSRTYLVRPAVNPAHVTSVMILLPQRSSQGVGNIWAEAAQVQAALRTIVTAGDSLAREAALAEAAARRAALDSGRRASIGDSLRPRADSTDTIGARLRGETIRRPRIVTPRVRPDTVQRDSAARDTTRRDTTVRRDTLRPRNP
jgi:rod shape-determining protein MreC